MAIMQDVWRTMYSSFLQELQAQFPDDPKVAAALAGAQDSGKLDEVGEILLPRAQLLMAKDPSAIDGLVIDGVDIAQLWSSESIAPQSKDAILQYLFFLGAIAHAVRSVPPEVLASLESLASMFGQGAPGPGSGSGEFAPGDLANVMPLVAQMLPQMSQMLPQLMGAISPGRGRDTSKAAGRKRSRTRHRA